MVPLTKSTNNKENKMKKDQLCLNISRRNKTSLDLVDDYSLQFNTNKTQTIFRILREYDFYKKRGVI